MSGEIKTHVIRVNTTGADGSASGTGQTDGPVCGEVLGVRLNFHTSLPATADTTLRTKGTGAASYNLLAVTDSATDGYFAPRAAPMNAANSAITNAHAPYVVDDYLEIAIAQGNQLTDAVIAHVFVRE